jgi:crotonobetainyl-CoA:carnitine CoA-transferase CaiB-like acyl-CoA transferase
VPQPLTGFQIADFSHVMAGPFCSHFLRMLGAEVTKVESSAGDALRNYGPNRDYDGMSPSFIAANVGKKSLVLDLKSVAGREVAERLIARSDVVLENFRPGVMERLGLGFKRAQQLRPGLIYCSVSGYGQSGPRRDYPAIDNIVQATSGMMSANGSEGDPPTRVGWPVVDTYTGTLAALAVVSALLQRERFGDGQYIDVAMLDASLVMLTSLATPFLTTGRPLPRMGDTGYSGAPTSGLFVARDSLRVSLGVVQNNQFASLCQAIGRHAVAVDARYATPVMRASHPQAAELRRMLDEEFLTRDAADWERDLSVAGVPCGLVRDVAAVCQLEGLRERGAILSTTAPGVKAANQSAAYINAGFVFEHDGPGADAHPPRLGEHSREVLSALGYNEAETAALLAAGAAWAAEET